MTLALVDAPASSLPLVALALPSTRRATAEGRFGVAFPYGARTFDRWEGRCDELPALVRLREVAGLAPIVTSDARAARDLLDRVGLDSPPLVWDVLELASLVAPTCPTLSLHATAAFFDVTTDPAGDGTLVAEAQLTHALMSRLVGHLEGLDATTLLHVNRLAAGLDWPLRYLFAEIERRRARSAMETSGILASATPIGGWIARGAAPARRRPSPPADAEPWASPINLEDVARRLAPAGVIAETLPAYEPRHEQVRMAEVVANTFNTGGQVLIEAGTGTGKSLAYLLPAALLALKTNGRVVVSTATTNLQDQLFEKDLPLVQASLGGDRPLRVTVLKGRANYLCLRRWQTLLHANDVDADDRRLLIKTLFWLPQTLTGDRAELKLSTGEEQAWQRLSAISEACTPHRCPYHRIGVCYLARARRAAEDSHLVIANHALLLSDLVTRSRILPEYQALVVDEAHHLEDEATSQLGWRSGEREMLSSLDRLWSPAGAAHGSTGAVPDALGLIGAAHGRPGAPVDLRAAVRAGDEAAHDLGQALRRFFDSLALLLADPEHQAVDDGITLRIGSALRAGSAWQAIEVIWQTAVGQQEALEAAVVEIAARLESLPGGNDAARDLAAEIASQVDALRELRRRVSEAVHAPDPGSVYWLACSRTAERPRGTGGRPRAAWLNAAPLEVAGMLRDQLFGASEAAALVSATLAIDGSFSYVKQRLGLGDAQAVALGSPFDYGRAALLYVPNDLPDPTQPGYQHIVERVLLDIVTRLGGRTLVLFTSRAQLRATYAAMRDPLAAKRITLLGQGINEGSRTRLLDAFRRGSRVVLFGTNAFWEGIDVVGDALSCVVVARLPFAVPTDPVYAARAEQFDEPFAQYAVPQAVLRLKQGFGRLIRSRSDRGAVVVLDKRLVTRAYGHVFVRSLPPCTVKQGPASRSGTEVDEWLRRDDPRPVRLFDLE